jgi:hypothetical protein
MSALTPKTDVCGANCHVCFGPIADIATIHSINSSTLRGHSLAGCQRERCSLAVTDPLLAEDFARRFKTHKNCYTENVVQRAKAMGAILRAASLIVTTAVVTLSSAANANHRNDAGGEHWYGRHIRWCSGPSEAFGLPYFYPCGRSRSYYNDGYRRYYGDRYRYYR